MGAFGPDGCNGTDGRPGYDILIFIDMLSLQLYNFYFLGIKELVVIQDGQASED